MPEEAFAVLDDPEVVNVIQKSTGEPISAVKRLNLNLAKKAFDELQELSRLTHQNMTELVRVGLGLVKIAYEAKRDNLKLAVVDSKGTALREIVIP